MIFKGIDSLYYLDFASAPGQPENMEKEAAGKKIAGYDTKAIGFVLNGDQKKIYYAPALYIDPKHTEENKIGANNVVDRETRSFRLETITSNHIYRQTESCYRVQPGKVDDAVIYLT